MQASVLAVLVHIIYLTVATDYLTNQLGTSPIGSLPQVLHNCSEVSLLAKKTPSVRSECVLHSVVLSLYSVS